MNDVSGFLEAIGDVPAIVDALTVKRRGRDLSANFSPILKRDGKDKVADLVVSPRNRDDLFRIAAAAARTKMPLITRGGGSANFGQNIPLRGGAIVDTLALDKVLWIKDAVVRSEAGVKISTLDEATRAEGWELRVHPSSKKMATIAGFVGGGHAGIGSCTYGILRDRGNIRALQVMSVEETPRIVELRGERVNLAHHAYGANGIITEVEMPLAPAWAWREAIVAFPDFMQAVEFAYALAVSDGILKKLISIIGWPLPSLVTRVAPFVPEGTTPVLVMIGEQNFEIFEELVVGFGGTITTTSLEGQGPYHGPIWEYSWGHTRMHINTNAPSLVSAIGLYMGADSVATIRKSYNRFKGLGPMHLEVKRFDGKLSFQGSPLFPFVDEAHMAWVMQGMAEDGAMVANNHTFLVKQGGMKSVTAEDVRFKREMDPYDLCNPGKLSFIMDEPEVETVGAGAALPSSGWSYDIPKAS